MDIHKFNFDFLKEFPGDQSYNLHQRQTPEVLYCLVKPTDFPEPSLIHFNNELGKELQWGNPETVDDILQLVGNGSIQELPTYATAYAGHQFGNWAGQLGDGRAIYCGTLNNVQNQTIEIQYKGAGPTPYSRRGDGRAVLRSSIREYLMSEAMHYLNIPTTRALSLALTGEKVARDKMYDGNVAYEPGATVIRTSPSFIRFGHFQLLAARRQFTDLKKLADWCIQRNSNIKIHSEKPYLNWFKNVVESTADLMVEWQRVGFVHGVMNTDNMSVIGETIDYGPFSFLDDFDLNFTPNTTDLPGRRYAFGEQPNIALWNLANLANSLHSIMEDTDELEEILNSYEDYFWTAYDQMFLNKLGLRNSEENKKFIKTTQQILLKTKADYTLFFSKINSSFAKANCPFTEEQFYEEFTAEKQSQLKIWWTAYQQLLKIDNQSQSDIQKVLKATNPEFVLRNYLLYECIEEVENGKMDKFNLLWNALQTPYETINKSLQKKRPDWASQTVGCSMLSCSS